MRGERFGVAVASIRRVLALRAKMRKTVRFDMGRWAAVDPKYRESSEQRKQAATEFGAYSSNT